MIGRPGRRFTWAGGFGEADGLQRERQRERVEGEHHARSCRSRVEPNDDIAHANLLSVNSYVIGSITTPDTRDVYAVTIPTAGAYTIETSGVSARAARASSWTRSCHCRQRAERSWA